MALFRTYGQITELRRSKIMNDGQGPVETAGGGAPVVGRALVLAPCSECKRPRSTDPDSEEGMSGMCLQCLNGGEPGPDQSPVPVPRDETVKSAQLYYGLAAQCAEALCHWRQDRGGAQAESHWVFHFGNPCPYEVVAAVLRGEPDPRYGLQGRARWAREEVDRFRGDLFAVLADVAEGSGSFPGFANRLREHVDFFDEETTSHGIETFDEWCCPACGARTRARMADGPRIAADPSVGAGTPASPAKCWCMGNPTVSHRRGTEGCRYAEGGDLAPAEAVSGGSGHAERQERWILSYAEDGAASLKAPPDLVEKCGHGMYLGGSFGGRELGTDLVEALVGEANDYRTRLARVVAGYELKVQEFAEETRRTGALTAEVARYRAAIDAVKRDLRKLQRSMDSQPYMNDVRPRLAGLVDALAAALGDGE